MLNYASIREGVVFSFLKVMIYCRCMLLGHHMRGVEYRLELSRTLSLSGDLDTGIYEN